MGHQFQRARRAEDKERRRQVILAAGRELLEQTGELNITVADVAARAGLGKATVFLYFPTKEALNLELLGKLLGEWFDDLDRELEKPGRLTAASLVRMLADSIAERGLLVRLTATASLLERHVEVEQVVRFKTELLARLAQSGAHVERRLKLPAGEGARLFLRLNALIVGLYQACDLGPVAREAMSRPELWPLRLDFEAELHNLLAALLRGLLCAPQSRRKGQTRNEKEGLPCLSPPPKSRVRLRAPAARRR